MNPNLQAVIEKVAKLRALAQSSNVHEASAAAAAAERLIAEHRLSEAEIESSSPQANEEPMDEDAGALFNGTQIPSWQWWLASRLAGFYGVALYVANVKREVATREYPYKKIETGVGVKMVGRRSDVEILRFQYAFLSLEISRLCESWASGHRFAKGDARTARNSFRIGAVRGVTEAMAEANREAREKSKATGSSAAMVLVDRKALAAAKLKELHPNLRSSGGGGFNVNGSAMADGERAGRGIHRGGALGTSSATRMMGSGK